MSLGPTIAMWLLCSLATGATAVGANFPAQASQPPAQQDSSPQPQPAGQGATPPLPAASEQNPPPTESAPEAAKPSHTGNENPAPAPAASSSAGQESQSAQPAPALAAPQTEPPQAPKKKVAPSAKSSSPKTKTAHRAQKPKSATASAKAATPKKVVVKNGSAVEPSVQLAPGLSQQQASNQRQGTSQLLTDTDENLKKISGRQLATNQQEMVQQIRTYMEQAKAATDAGDLERAHNLALKASLLAQELAKP